METQPAVRSLAATLLVIIASFYTLYFARAFFLPVTFGLLLNLLLSPFVRTLKRARIPYPIGAAIVVLSIVAVVGVGGYFLADPAQEWVTKAPQSVAAANVKIRKLRRPMEQVTKSADQMARAATTGSSTPRVQEVTLAGPTLMDRFVGASATFLAGALETLVLLYFLLASGDLFLQKLTKMLPEFRDKKKAVAIARETRDIDLDVSHHRRAHQRVRGRRRHARDVGARRAQPGAVGRARALPRVHPLSRRARDGRRAHARRALHLRQRRPHR